MTYYDINVRLVPILDLVSTFWVITQKYMIPIWNGKFFTMPMQSLLCFVNLLINFKACLLAFNIAFNCWFNQIVLDLKLSGL